MAKALPLQTIPVYSKEHLPDPEIDFSAGAIILMDKPKEWTSFDVVKYTRGRIREKKLGHAGTLDPMATGLLVLCSGKATKSISQIQEMPKTYIGEITFGGSTPSYDADSDVDVSADFDHITEKLIREKLETEFSGEIMQVPPVYSALKVGGRKSYELARRGKEVELQARPVTIHSFEIIKYEAPKLILLINCSKGTYIRSIAHDLGIALDSRAHLSALKRTKIGDYESSIAITPQEIDKLLRPENG